MKKGLKKTISLIIILSSALALLVGNKTVWGSSGTPLNSGDRINIQYKIAYPHGILNLYHRDPGFLFFPQEIKDFRQLNIDKQGSAANTWPLSVNDDWPKGDYLLRFNGSPPYLSIATLDDVGKSPRGITDFEKGKIFDFNAGPCPAGYTPPKIGQPAQKPAEKDPEKPANSSNMDNTDKTKDFYEAIKKECDKISSQDSPPGVICYSTGTLCFAKKGKKDECIKEGSQKGLEVKEGIGSCDQYTNTQKQNCYLTVVSCFEGGGNKEQCIEAGKPIVTQNPLAPSQDSGDYDKILEEMRSEFKKNAEGACKGYYGEDFVYWRQKYPNYQPGDENSIKQCITRATSCFSGKTADIQKNGLWEVWNFCISSAIESQTQGGETGNTPSGGNTNTGSTADTQPVGDESTEGNEEPSSVPDQSQVVDVPTKITPYINGQWEASTVDVNSKGGRLAVGARLTPVSVPEGANWTTDDCIRDEVSLTLRKTQGDEIKISKERADGSGEKDEDLAEGKFQNCQSYWASIDGPGSYTLTAIYNGGEEGRYNFLPAPVSGNQVTVIDGKEAIKTESKINVKVNTTSNKQTKARTLLAGKFGKDQRVVWKTQSSNVAGIRVEQQGDSYVATPDVNSEEWLVLTPEIQIEGRDLTASQNEIPTVSFSVVKVTNSGENLPIFPIFNMPNYPNGQSKIFSEADLGDLNSINHIEATVTGTDLNSEYEIKPEDIRIDVNPSGTPVAEATFVKLTTDPLIYEIFPGATKVTITASTNRVVQNPLFESTVNGVEQNSLAAQESSDNCADGTGICEYSYTFYQPGPGSYSITFRNGDVSDRVDFTINSKETVEEATSLVEFLYKGEKINSDDFITLDLGENVFERVIHSSNGDIRQSFTIIVEDTSEPEPGQTQLSWFCEGDLIIQEENGNRTINKDCASEGKSCRQVDTPGYDSDAECYTPEPSTEQKLSELKWYCDGNIIIQDANGNVTIHYDCSEQGQTCRAKTDTPGYPVDAECYVSDEPNDELTPQPQSNSLKWYCDGNIIIEDQNGNTRVNRDCGAEGLSCRLIDSPPGYESDAECYSQEQSSDTSGGLPQESYIYWYCEGEMIKQNENGNVTDHYDCAEYGQYCRLIDTLGYSSDAECYIP